MRKARPNPCVLVVDDDVEALEAARLVLSTRFAVRTAVDGESVLSIAREVKPAAIVLDVVMPGGKNGFTILRELGNDSETRDIPVLLLTGVNQSAGMAFGLEELDRYLGRKPAAFLEKPISPTELLRQVSAAVGEK
jgi:CheY-like chemotaxis protein